MRRSKASSSYLHPLDLFPINDYLLPMRNERGSLSGIFALPGILLILFGVAILIVPELLAVLVASALIFVGALLLTLAYNGRKANSSNTVWYQVDRWGP